MDTAEKSSTLRPQNVATEGSAKPQNEAIISNKSRINFVWIVIMRLLCAAHIFAIYASGLYAVKCRCVYATNDFSFNLLLSTFCVCHFQRIHCLGASMTFTHIWYGTTCYRMRRILFCGGHLKWSDSMTFVKSARNIKHCVVGLKRWEFRGWEQRCKNQMFI